MSSHRERVFFRISFGYVMVVLGCLIALLLIPHHATEWQRNPAPGCQVTYDQLIFGATCHGFFGDDALAAVLSLPMALFLLPLSALGVLAEALEVAHLGRILFGVAGLFMGASLWAPLAYFVGAVRRLALRDDPRGAPLP